MIDGLERLLELEQLLVPLVAGIGIVAGWILRLELRGHSFRHRIEELEKSAEQTGRHGEDIAWLYGVLNVRKNAGEDRST